MNFYSKLEIPEQDKGISSSRMQSFITRSSVGNSQFVYRSDFCILWNPKQVLYPDHKCPKNQC